MRWSRKSELGIHQFVPSFSPGDAIGSEVIALQRTFREWGAVSRIYAGNIHAALEGRADYFERYHSSPDDVAIFHFAIGSPLSVFVEKLPIRKVLLYHNITPAHYFRGHNPELVALLERAHEELASFRDSCSLALADSEYNRKDLEGLDFPRTAVLPILLDMGRYQETDERVLRAYAGGGPRFLSVSRIVPSKRIEDVVRIFYYYRKCISSQAQLFLVGSGDTGGNYLPRLKQFVVSLGLEGVVFTDSVSDAVLAAYYQLADAFLTMSEHEGFCMPLVESMLFDVPIVAYKAGAVPYTLDGAGILVNRKDPAEIAELLHVIVRDPGLKARLLSRQRARLEFFRPERVKTLLRGYLEKLGIVFPHPGQGA